MTITLDAVSKVYKSAAGDEVVALDRVTTSFADGEFVSLLGPSGCGKSTLLALLAGLEAPTAGTITDGDASAAGPRPGVVFQDSLLLPWRTVLANVVLPSQVGPGRSRGRAWRAVANERALDLLALVGLAGFENRYPHELSGGMQQRVSIARGMFHQSPTMLFDEPFSALDEFTREQMHVILQDVAAARPFAAVFVTHNVQEAVFLSDRVCVMTPRPGRIVAEVKIDLPRPRTLELLSHPAFLARLAELHRILDHEWTRKEPVQ